MNRRGFFGSLLGAVTAPLAAKVGEKDPGTEESSSFARPDFVGHVYFESRPIAKWDSKELAECVSVRTGSEITGS